MNLEFIKLPPYSAPLPQKYLQAKMQKAWGLLLNKRIVSRRTPKQLSLVWVVRSRSKKLNLQYRGQNKATDVLSFQHLYNETLMASGAQSNSIGELVLCADVIKAKAQVNQISFRDYSLYCILHGVLHLLGFDHETPSEAEKMLTLQDSVFYQL